MLYVYHFCVDLTRYKKNCFISKILFNTEKKQKIFSMNILVVYATKFCSILKFVYVIVNTNVDSIT